MDFFLRNGFRFGRLVLRNSLKEASRPMIVPKCSVVRFYSETAPPPVQKIRNTSKVLKQAGVKGGSAEKVTLHGLDGSISITSLDEAQKMAKRRGLRLLKETDFDGKSQRPVYKFITKQEEILSTATPGEGKPKAQQQQQQSTKSDKMLSMNNKIADHDLQSRLKHIHKWLTKQHKVIVVISGSVSDLATSEKIYQQMEETAKGIGRIVQKRMKGSEIRFQILPNPPPENVTSPKDVPPESQRAA